MIVGNYRIDIANAETDIVELKIGSRDTYERDIVVIHLDKSEALALSIALKTEANRR